MTLQLPDPRVDQQSWDLERRGVQRNFEAFAQRFPLECSTDHFRQVPQARVYNNVNISVPNTETALTFNAERWDLGTSTEQHSTSSSTGRLTCRVAGLYRITANVEFAASAAGSRQVRIKLNGTTVVGDELRAADSANSTRVQVATDYRLAVGEYAEVLVYQGTAGNLNVLASNAFSPEFMWHWVSP